MVNESCPSACLRTDLCMYVAVIFFAEILDNFSICMLTVLHKPNCIDYNESYSKRHSKYEGKRFNNNYHIFTIQGKPELLMEKELWIRDGIMQTYFEIFRTIPSYL